MKNLKIVPFLFFCLVQFSAYAQLVNTIEFSSKKEITPILCGEFSKTYEFFRTYPSYQDLENNTNYEVGLGLKFTFYTNGILKVIHWRTNKEVTGSWTLKYDDDGLLYLFYKEEDGQNKTAIVQYVSKEGFVIRRGGECDVYKIVK